MNKLAYYASGVAAALKEFGMVKVAVSDDINISDEQQNTPDNQADELARVFSGMGPMHMGKQSPDNTTKKDPKEKDVNWGAPNTPTTSETLDRFSISADIINTGDNY